MDKIEVSQTFQREERYIVIKRKHLPKAVEEALRQYLHDDKIDTVECVVVESDWPEYDTVWGMIEQRCTETPANRTDATPVAWMPDFQAETDQWMDACFGSTIKADTLERDDRFIEECLELVQTNPAFTADRAHALVDYVFGRPVGEPFQETGGVMVTLAARSNAAGISIKDAAETELARVWTKVEAIRAKQAAKPVGSALPIAVTHPPATDVAALVEAAKELVADCSYHLRKYRPAQLAEFKVALAPFTKGQP